MILREIEKIFFLVIILFSFFWFSGSSFSQETPTPTSTPNTSEILKKISEYEQKIADLKGQEKTLSSQIAVMDSQIKLTEFRIQATQEEITGLTLDIDTATKKVSSLQKALDNSVEVLLNRIVATYQVGTIQPLQILLTSGSASDFLQRLNYLKLAQAHDKKLIYDTQQAKTDYANQKEIFEDEKTKVEVLKKQLEGYTAQLNQEKAAKQRLLTETQGNEATYQRLLAQARAEYEAILGIVSGKGSEVEVGGVSERARIASIIQGPSCNSGGSHVHFIVRTNGTTQNPFNYLSSADYENCSGSSCNSGDGDPFNPSGSWNWPINPKIKFNQGYGNTWAVNHTWVGQIYNFHNGIDINSDSSEVKAVRSGTLFRGSYSGSGGCALRYVRVKHNEDGIDTLYLHVNY